MKTYTVPQELMQKFLNYLVNRPYIETYQLVDELKVLPVIEHTEQLASGNVLPLNPPIGEIIEVQEAAKA